MAKFVFVLEETLGHIAHARNVERALAHEPDIEATIIRIPYRPSPGWNRLPLVRSWSFRSSWAARGALRRRFRQEGVDAIFIHTQVAALLARRAMRLAPTVVSLDASPLNFDSQGSAYGHHLDAPGVERAKRWVNQRAFRFAAAFVTWCDWAKASLIRDYGVPADKVRVVRPGVDLGVFRPADRSQDRQRMRILFVGGDFHRKGGPDLLMALGRLGDRAELDVVTTSPMRTVPGDLPYRIHRGLNPQSDALVDLYRRADVFVLPSRGDCFPQAIAEAMACGLPVVASRVGAIPEMVRDGENGFLIPPASPRALARALAELMERPVLRRSMGQQSRRLALEEHNADRNNRGVFALMAELAAAPVANGSVGLPQARDRGASA